MKKTLSIILVIVMLMALVPAAFAEVTSVVLDKTSDNIETVGGTSTLTATVNVTASEAATVTWSSSDESVATVADGVVTAVAKGKATITATSTEDPTKSASCEVIVGKKVDKPVPAFETPVVYTGNDIAYIPSSAGYSVADGTKTAVGTYKAVVTLGNEYIWSDGTIAPLEFDWSIVYKVTFDANGHGTAPAAVTTTGDAVSNPGTLTATGYTHDGSWYTEAACTNVFDFSKPIEKNETLYAKWTPNTYKITLAPGANGQGTAVEATKYHDVILPLPNVLFTRAGYAQSGWSLTDGGAKAYDLGANFTENKDTTLYPYWVSKTTSYTVTMGKYSGANLGNASYSLSGKDGSWVPVTSTTGTQITVPAGTTMWFKMVPNNGYYRHPYVVNANGSYYSPGYGEIFSVYINENKTVKLNFSQYVPTGDAGVWGYVVTMLASAGTAAGVYFGTKKKK